MASKNASPADDADQQFEAEVYEVLRDEGIIIPLTESEVAELEQRSTGEPPPLPTGLADAKAVFARVVQVTPHRRQRLPASSDTAIAENLARAARDGGTIPPDLEDQMRRDRERAERDGSD